LNELKVKKDWLKARADGIVRLGAVLGRGPCGPKSPGAQRTDAETERVPTGE
jgi:hypothetical protein